MEFQEFKSAVVTAFETRIAIEDEAMRALHRYHELLYIKNSEFNLTAISEADAPKLSFADSLSALSYVTPGARVIDVGSGAGFPGLCLAVCAPDAEVCLVDALNKRVKFLQEVADELGLKNVYAIHARSEDIAHDADFREAYDIATARAVAALPALLELALPLVRPGGRMLAFKGAGAEAELAGASNALKLLGAGTARIEAAGLLGLEHRLVVIEKGKATPKQYPRRMVAIKKQPL